MTYSNVWYINGSSKEHGSSDSNLMLCWCWLLWCTMSGVRLTCITGVILCFYRSQWSIAHISIMADERYISKPELAVGFIWLNRLSKARCVRIDPIQLNHRSVKSSVWIWWPDFLMKRFIMLIISIESHRRQWWFDFDEPKRSIEAFVAHSNNG